MAICLAMITRRVILSLAIGVATGAVLLRAGGLFATLKVLCYDLLWLNLIDTAHLQVFAFTALMGAMVAVMHASGGMQTIVLHMLRWAHNRRRGQLVAWLIGLLVFFDDYANTLLLGTTLRPLIDRLNISREKLAYIVDSTAAPVAGLAIVSTWVATEIQYIDEGLATAGAQTAGAGVQVFLATIPYRFYPLFALALVAIIGWSGRDFGPMLDAERDAQRRRPGQEKDDEVDASATEAPGPRSAAWLCAVLPIGVVVFGTIGMIASTGRTAMAGQGTFAEWITHGDSYIALVVSSLCGCLLAVLLAFALRAAGTRDILGALRGGVLQMAPALAILWLAWTMADLTSADRLGTGKYAAEALRGNVSLWLLPTLTFLTAAAVAFCTGTSWGTMAILTPMVVEVSWNMLAGAERASLEDPIFLGAIGSVLAGAIMGDHCSPLSDTTILSSRASGCNHMQHVWTQMPYAICVGVVSILCGTLPIGWGMSLGLLLPAGFLALVGIVYLCGRLPAA
ncbi:MAG: hypothetical protein KDA42_12225 [Planctomycetales bacterium]|nr:hypothetical protein [Planctomycetales bacterium]